MKVGAVFTSVVVLVLVWNEEFESHGGVGLGVRVKALPHQSQLGPGPTRPPHQCLWKKKAGEGFKKNPMLNVFRRNAKRGSSGQKNSKQTLGPVRSLV